MKSILGIIRLPFLMLTPACASVGLATSYYETGHLRPLHAALVILGAVAAHASVNAFNEYFDFKSGLDAKTTRTPFSGGSGTLPARPGLERLALAVAVSTFAVTAGVGLYFVYYRGPWLIPVGALGLLLLVGYTLWFVNNPLLCLVAPGLGFGTLMVNGAHFAMTGVYSFTALTASMVPFFLVSNLLLLNQFPDVKADAEIGRRHFPIAIGNRNSSIIYGLFLLLTYVVIAGGVFAGILPRFCLIALITAIPSVKAYAGARRNANDIPALVPSMGLNVIINLATPSLLALGLFIG